MPFAEFDSGSVTLCLWTTYLGAVALTPVAAAWAAVLPRLAGTPRTGTLTLSVRPLNRRGRTTPSMRLTPLERAMGSRGTPPWSRTGGFGRASASDPYNRPVPARRAHAWRFLVAAPPREVFAVMEQMIGTPPFRFEVTGDDSARIVEFQRNSLVGHWRRIDGSGTFMGRQRRPVRSQRWVSCRADLQDAGTIVEMEASAGRGALPRALQLIGVLTGGDHDPRTIYRHRQIPPGPVTLVASWAGMAYPLYAEPHRGAARGVEIFTATRMAAVPGGTAEFIKVQLSDGVEGYVERDQVVAAPERATRQAGVETARYV